MSNEKNNTVTLGELDAGAYFQRRPSGDVYQKTDARRNGSCLVVDTRSGTSLWIMVSGRVIPITAKLVIEQGSGWAMSDTIVDMSKLRQILNDAWEITMHANASGNYTVNAWHSNLELMNRAEESIQLECNKNLCSRTFHPEDDSGLVATGSTPEQALMRMIYRVVDGKII